MPCMSPRSSPNTPASRPPTAWKRPRRTPMFLLRRWSSTRGARADTCVGCSSRMGGVALLLHREHRVNRHRRAPRWLSRRRSPEPCVAIAAGQEGSRCGTGPLPAPRPRARRAAQPAPWSWAVAGGLALQGDLRTEGHGHESRTPVGSRANRTPVHRFRSLSQRTKAAAAR